MGYHDKAAVSISSDISEIVLIRDIPARTTEGLANSEFAVADFSELKRTRQYTAGSHSAKLSYGVLE